MTLKEWWKAACKHGTIYYVVEHESHRATPTLEVTLWTVARRGGRTVLVEAWPRNEAGEYDEAIAKRLGFWVRKQRRAWRAVGGNCNLVFEIIKRIAMYAEPGVTSRGVQSCVRWQSLHKG